jgi:hypothetical protein
VALELNGYSGLVLDSYDLWVFERYEREAGQS